jgi:hypothetical protein
LQKQFGEKYKKAVGSIVHGYFVFQITDMVGFVYLELVSEAREAPMKRHIANLIALPMVPTYLVRQRFKMISKQLSYENPSFDRFILYFRRTYINSKRFPIPSWNHYNFLGTRPRTNNHLEGSHRQLKT